MMILVAAVAVSLGSPAPQAGPICEKPIAEQLASSGPSSTSEDLSVDADIKEWEAMADTVAADPGSADPMAIFGVGSKAFKRGDYQQAAFWLVVWEIRTLPEASSVGQFHTYSTRRMLLKVFGAGALLRLADYEVAKETTRRAISFESKLLEPVQSSKMMSAKAWSEHVQICRSGYRAAAESDFAKPNAAKDRADYISENFPLVAAGTSLGAPLKEEWR